MCYGRWLTLNCMNMEENEFLFNPTLYNTFICMFVFVRLSGANQIIHLTIDELAICKEKKKWYGAGDKEWK